MTLGRKKTRLYTKAREKAFGVKRDFVVLLLTLDEKSIEGDIYKESKTRFFHYDFVRQPVKNVVNIIEENIKNKSPKETYLTYENLKNLTSYQIYRTLPLSIIENFSDSFFKDAPIKFLVYLNSLLSLSTSTKFLHRISGVVNDELVLANLGNEDREKLLQLKNKVDFLLSIYSVNIKDDSSVLINGEKYISITTLTSVFRYNYFSNKLFTFFKEKYGLLKSGVVTNNDPFSNQYIKYDDVLSFLGEHYIKDGELTKIELSAIPYFYTYSDLLNVFEQKRIGSALLRRINYFKITSASNIEDFKRSTGKALYRAIDIYEFLLSEESKHRKAWNENKINRLLMLIKNEI